MSTGYGPTIFFQICHCAELNKIVDATIPVNPYDDRKVSLRRPHGNGDLDIVRASYTRRNAYVTMALDQTVNLSLSVYKQQVERKIYCW